jgi:hypothetical protein
MELDLARLTPLITLNLIQKKPGLGRAFVVHAEWHKTCIPKSRPSVHLLNTLRKIWRGRGIQRRRSQKSQSPISLAESSNHVEGHFMGHASSKPSIALLTLAFALSTQSAPAQSTQTTPSQPPAQTQATPQPQPRSAGGDVGSGAGDIGKGTAKGTGAAAEGVGKGAGDLVTLHPAEAAGNVGKGAVVTGKDVGVGAAKGTGKITKGTGRGIGKIFHHGHHDETPQSSSSNPQN